MMALSKPIAPVDAPDYRSNVRFLAEGLEGLVFTAALLPTWPISRRWLGDWGSHPVERSGEWPGDRLVGECEHIVTRAVEINAPSERVWRWVVQFGLGRAGFYSYELLERLAGIPVRNVESIVPSLQTLSVGDEIKLHPKSPGIPVGALEANRHICFGELNEDDQSAARTDPRRSWSIYISPIASDSCRLIVRSCIEPLRNPSVLKRLGLALEMPIDFLMEQRMLRTIKRLCESG